MTSQIVSFLGNYKNYNLMKETAPLKPHFYSSFIIIFRFYIAFSTSTMSSALQIYKYNPGHRILACPHTVYANPNGYQLITPGASTAVILLPSHLNPFFVNSICIFSFYSPFIFSSLIFLNFYIICVCNV